MSTKTRLQRIIPFNEAARINSLDDDLERVEIHLHAVAKKLRRGLSGFSPVTTEDFHKRERFVLHIFAFEDAAKAIRKSRIQMAATYGAFADDYDAEREYA